MSSATAPRKVTVVGPTNPYKGGIAQHTTELAQHLADEGHIVDLLSWLAQYPAFLYPGQLVLDDFSTELQFDATRRALRWYDPTGWWRHALGPAGAPDLLVLALVNGVQVPAYRTIMHRARRGGARVVAVCHNVVPHESDAVQRRLMAGLLRSVDVAVVHSEDEARRARDIGVADVRVVPLPFFFPARRGGISTGVHNRVANFGLVRPYKGVEVLVDALALTETNVSVTVAGEFWTPASEILARAESRGVSDRVIIREGYLDAEDVIRLLSTHDALVLPYVSGTGSQQPRIGHLAATPVIASRIAAFADQVRDGVDGLLVDPGDAADLARALDELYVDGRLDALRAATRPPDVEAEWAAYLAAVTGA